MPTNQLQYRNNATNKRKVLDLIRNYPEITTNELSNLTRLSQPEVIHLLMLLCNRKRIVRMVKTNQKTYLVYKTNQGIKQ